MLHRAATIGYIAGIPIRIHWSWLVVLLAVIAMLSQIYADTEHSAGAWSIALAAGLLLCASVLLHELGHALIAQHYHVAVRGITLFALGGVTEIIDDNPRPIQELLIAAAGPAVSLLLALGSALIWWSGSSIIPPILALHIALTNGLMAVFNLLPGFPMDGGRILRAVIWFLTDDELLAALAVTWAGRACGVLIIFGGIMYALHLNDPITGAWIGIIGYYLSRNAPQGYRQTILRRCLSGVFVSDLMYRAYRAVGPDLRLDQFVGRYVLGQIDQGFPVLQQPDANEPQPLLGMITVRNLRRFSLSEWAYTYVGEAMTPAHRVRALTAEMPAGEAFQALIDSGEEQLPVLHREALLGVLRQRDLLAYIRRQSNGRL